MQNTSIVSMSSYMNRNTEEASDLAEADMEKNNETVEVTEQVPKYSLMDEGAKTVYDFFMGLEQNPVKVINTLSKILKNSIIELYQIEFDRKKTLITVKTRDGQIGKRIDFERRKFIYKTKEVIDVFDNFEVIDSTHCKYRNKVLSTEKMDSSFRYCIENHISYVKSLRADCMKIAGIYNRQASTRYGLFKAYFRYLDEYLNSAYSRKR